MILAHLEPGDQGQPQEEEEEEEGEEGGAGATQGRPRGRTTVRGGGAGGRHLGVRGGQGCKQ